MNIYLFAQGKGQLNMLFQTEKIEDKISEGDFSNEEIKKLKLIEEVKRFSIDSLNYKSSNSYESYFNNQIEGKLWVLTACKPDSFAAYQWNFPMLGLTDYKGFFNYASALKEARALYNLGYDVDVSEVGAWSTLGILNDPVFFSMLKKPEYKLVNLIFHELFHSTRYLESSTAENENLANFVGHFATIRFLKKYPEWLKQYVNYCNNDSIFTSFIEKKKKFLSKAYNEKLPSNNFSEHKDSLWAQIIIEGDRLFKNFNSWNAYREEMIQTKNAFIMHFVRYDGSFDSLNKVLNAKYNGNISLYVQALKE